MNGHCKQNLTVKALLFFLCISISTLAFSKDKDSSYRGPYGMAGCGFGSMVIEKNQKLHQLGAALLNGILGNQTFGMTSGTSNCNKNLSDTAMRMEKEVFVGANLNSLKIEAAQGNGEHLLALAEVFGCTESKIDQSLFLEISKNNHQTLFDSEEPKTIVNKLTELIRHHESLAASCSRLG